MDLTHRFTVPTSVDQTWAHFNDIASVAQCFPGAVVTEATEESFAGSVKVKLGPIALQYNGSGTFVEKDESAKRFVIDARGKDKRGNGTAGAKVTVSMSAAADSSTEVEVLTDLAITGKPAQFGRGVMQDVSDKLLGKFVECLEKRLSGGSAEAEPAAAEPAPVAADGQAAASEPVETAEEAGATVSGKHMRAVDGGADDAAESSANAAGQTSTESDSASAAKPAAAASNFGPVAGASGPADDEALDLGAAVLPVLIKSYGKQIAAVGVVAFVVALLLRRRRR